MWHKWRQIIKNKQTNRENNFSSFVDSTRNGLSAHLLDDISGFLSFYIQKPAFFIRHFKYDSEIEQKQTKTHTKYREWIKLMYHQKPNEKTKYIKKHMKHTNIYNKICCYLK